MAGSPKPWAAMLSGPTARICRSGAWLFGTLLVSAFLPFAELPWLWIPVIVISVVLTWLMFRDVRELWFRGALDLDEEDDAEVAVGSDEGDEDEDEDPDAGFQKLDLGDLDFDDEFDDESGDESVAARPVRPASAAPPAPAVPPAPQPGAARQLDFDIPTIPARTASPAPRPAAAPGPRPTPPRPAAVPRHPEPRVSEPARPEPQRRAPQRPGTRSAAPRPEPQPDVAPVDLDGAGLAIEISALRGSDVELAIAADDGRVRGAARLTVDLESALRFGDALRGFPGHDDDRRDATLGRIDPADPHGALRLVLFQAGGSARVFVTVWPEAGRGDPAARQVASVAIQADPQAVRAFVDELASAVLVPGSRVVLALS